MGALRIGILGAGGVGGLLAGTLARQGAQVVCIAPSPTVRVINERGISISSERFGTFRQVVHAEEVLSRPVDVLCVAVKSTSLVNSLQRVPVDVLGDSLVVPFLNGIEHVDILRRHRPLARVIAATIRIESERIDAGEIIQKSPFAAIELAASPDEFDVVTSLSKLLLGANFDVQLCEGEQSILWGKLSFLAPMALLTSAHNVPIGLVRTVFREELVGVIDEVTRVAKSANVIVDPERILAQLDGVPESMQSSMQIDASLGLPIEIDAIGGAVLRAADSASISTPRVSELVNKLLSLHQDSNFS